MAEELNLTEKGFVEKGARSMTPEQTVMSRAREEVLLHKADFVKAGGSEELVKRAAEEAGNRALTEFKEREQTDPFFRLEQSILEAALTQEQQNKAEKFVAELEDWRVSLTRSRREVEALPNHEGMPFKQIAQEARLVSGDWNQNDLKELRTHVRYPFLFDRDLNFTLSVLHSLGLNKNLGLKDLDKFPEDTRKNDSEYQIPSNISGVMVGARIPREEPDKVCMTIQLNLEGLDKVTSLAGQ